MCKHRSCPVTRTEVALRTHAVGGATTDASASCSVAGRTTPRALAAAQNGAALPQALLQECRAIRHYTTPSRVTEWAGLTPATGPGSPTLAQRVAPCTAAAPAAACHGGHTHSARAPLGRNPTTMRRRCGALQQAPAHALGAVQTAAPAPCAALFPPSPARRSARAAPRSRRFTPDHSSSFLAIFAFRSSAYATAFAYRSCRGEGRGFREQRRHARGRVA